MDVNISRNVLYLYRSYLVKKYKSIRMKRKRVYLFVCLFLVCLVCRSMAQFQYSDRPVVLTTETGQIKGKMMVPGTGTGYPVVLLIAGSGPTDMDGNSAPMQMTNNSLKYLAEGLASKGVASLRFDKRGIATSASAGKDEYSMRFEDNINDVKGWIDYLARDRRFSGVYVAGHSEGALVGLIASQANPKVKGYISIAGAGRPLYEVLEEQLASQPEAIRQLALPINDSLKVGKLVPNVPLGLQALFRSSVQPYLISCYKYKPQTEIKKLTIPILLLQGKTDIQVSVKDAELLKQSAPSAQLHLIDNMNHILKDCPTTDRQKQIATYMDPNLPVDTSLLLFIEKFVKKP